MKTALWIVLAGVLLSAGLASAALAGKQNVTVRQFDPSTGTWVRKERELAFKAPWSDGVVKPEIVPFSEKLPAGSIVVDTAQRRLFHVRGDGTAMRYGIGVGREGFEWRGREKISRKAEWPSWRPPAEMIRREAAQGRVLPTVMEGGPENPLGARALYLGSTLFRIHGTNQPWTIGKAVSSGCIRMINDDIVSLYNQVKVGTLVVVR